MDMSSGILLPEFSVLCLFLAVLCADRKLCQRGSTFLVDEWREDPNTTKKVSSLNVGLVAMYISRGSGPVLLRNPIAL